MPGLFGLIGSNRYHLLIKDFIEKSYSMRNCKKKIIERPNCIFASASLEARPLKGDFFFEDERWSFLFDGDLVPGPIALEDEGIPWRKISRIFERKAYEEFRELRGIFSIAAFNRENRSLFLVTDRLGMSPLFYLKLSDGFCFSTSLQSFFGLDEELRIDIRYIYDWLFFNFPVGNETALEGVYRLERASVMEISEEGKVFSINKYAPDFRVAEKLTERNEAFDFALNIFEERIQKYFTDRVPMAASVTGGWDGVTNLAFKPPNIRIQTYTYGIKGTEDIIGGARVAKALDLPHIPIYFNGEIIKSLPEYCIKTVYLSGGSQGILRSTLLPVYQTLANNHNVCCVVSGIAASNILRGRSNTPSLISPGVKALFTQEKQLEDLLEEWKGFFSANHETGFFAHIKSRIKELGSQFGHLEDIESQLLYHIYIVFPRYFGGEYNLARNWLTLRIPFLDSDILNFIFSTKIAGLSFSEYSKEKTSPHDERLLQAFLIAKKSPHLRQIRIGNVTPENITSSGILSVTSRLFRKSLNHLRGRFYQRPPLENWDVWVDEALSEFTKRFVLSADSRISQIINLEAIEGIFKGTGNPIRTNMIGKLLTLEIAWRLIEGGWKESSVEVI